MTTSILSRTSHSEIPPSTSDLSKKSDLNQMDTEALNEELTQMRQKIQIAKSDLEQFIQSVTFKPDELDSLNNKKMSDVYHKLLNLPKNKADKLGKELSSLSIQIPLYDDLIAKSYRSLEEVEEEYKRCLNMSLYSQSDLELNRCKDEKQKLELKIGQKIQERDDLSKNVRYFQNRLDKKTGNKTENKQKLNKAATDRAPLNTEIDLLSKQINKLESKISHLEINIPLEKATAQRKMESFEQRKAKILQELHDRTQKSVDLFNRRKEILEIFGENLTSISKLNEINRLGAQYKELLHEAAKRSIDIESLQNT
jgi:chromosome segregation ATPase